MTTIVDSNLPVARPSWDHSRLEARFVLEDKLILLVLDAARVKHPA